MKVYIKEWADKTASIPTGNGQVVWTFSSASGARQACTDWYSSIRSGRDALCAEQLEGAPVSCSLGWVFQAITGIAVRARSALLTTRVIPGRLSGFSETGGGLPCFASLEGSTRKNPRYAGYRVRVW